MSIHTAKELIQIALNRFGLQIRRVDQGVSYTDPYLEQVRLLKNLDVNVVFEIGASDGRDCVKYAELFPMAQVVGFEPVPSSFQKLQERIKPLKDRISINNVAMSSQVGHADFNIAEWDDASSLLKAKNTGSTFDVYNSSCKTIQVKTETVNNYTRNSEINRIDLLKMDAQGAELDILRGADDHLCSSGISLVYTEVSFMEIYQDGATFESLSSYLKERGYLLHNLYGLSTNQKGQLTWGDAIFVRKELMC